MARDLLQPESAHENRAHTQAHESQRELLQARLKTARRPDTRCVARYTNLSNLPADPKFDHHLDDRQIEQAIAYNNRSWQGEFASQIKRLFNSDNVKGEFTAADVIKIANLQGLAGLAADGKLGDRTMAVLTHTAPPGRARPVTLTTAENLKPTDVTLEFYPGELEDLKAWNLRQRAFGKNQSLSELEKDHLLPTGSGRIYVRVHGHIVAAMEARGGPSVSFKDSGGHAATPTAPGEFHLGKQESHTTASWSTSQISWGRRTRLRSDSEWEFEETPGLWTIATGPHARVKIPMEKLAFEKNRQHHQELQSKREGMVEDGRRVPNAPFLASEPAQSWPWLLNDFGESAWNLTAPQGRTALYLHTTPFAEQAAMLGKDLVLTSSHGCIHIQPSQRDDMMRKGYIQPGVKFVVHRYEQHLLPAPIIDALHK